MANLAALTCLMLAILFSAPKTPTPGTIKTAYNFERQGIMSHSEFIRLSSISTKIEAGGKVTDADLDFALGLLKAKPVNSRCVVFRYYQVVSYSTDDYHHWTPRQKDKLFQAALWLLSQPEPKNQLAGNSPSTTEKIPAIILLARVNDKRCLSYLSKLEKDPNPTVAEMAKGDYDGIVGGNK